MHVTGAVFKQDAFINTRDGLPVGETGTTTVLYSEGILLSLGF